MLRLTSLVFIWNLQFILVVSMRTCFTNEKEKHALGCKVYYNLLKCVNHMCIFHKKVNPYSVGHNSATHYIIVLNGFPWYPR